MTGLFLRATLPFLTLPGVVAFAVPVLVFGPGDPAASARLIGLIPSAPGSRG